MSKIKTIYCDFDGTITKYDAVNTFFDLYAPKEWMESEALWIEGKISSRENAIRQVSMLPALTDKAIDDYINSIKIDEYFVEFTNLLDEKGIKLVILSDGFDLFIKKTLEKYNIKNVEFFANHLIHEKNGKFSIEFPFFNEKCEKQAGMCKCNKVQEEDFCYIGDGTSDLCIAKKASILFASKVLNKYCEQNGIKHIPFKSFLDIMETIKKI